MSDATLILWDEAQLGYDFGPTHPMRPLRLESATEVRARVASGDDWQALVPADVARFIRQQGLYRPGGAGQGV